MHIRRNVVVPLFRSYNITLCFDASFTRDLGIALVGDPDFDIFRASYPYATRRAAEIYGAHSWNRLRWLGIGNKDVDNKVHER